VERHRQKVLEKPNPRDRVALTLYAARRGLGDLLTRTICTRIRPRGVSTGGDH
jgi:hypothetical protein